MIRYVAEHPYFSGLEHITIIETTCRPLLQYIANPQNIDFDDDIVFFVTQMIQKRAQMGLVINPGSDETYIL